MSAVLLSIVYPQVGRFPLAMCESEGMTSVLRGRCPPSLEPQDYAGCTSGLVVTGPDVVVTSQLLDVDTVAEDLHV